MACLDGQQKSFKHHCRVCNKGFMCGRALGGHMRAHGIGDENGNLGNDDDLMRDWEDKLGGSDRPGNKRMYQLRTNPNRLKSCRNCENCGKEFSCWKSFLEHGKCSSDVSSSASLVSSPESEDDDDTRGHNVGWSKKKRSLRTKVSTLSSTSEDDDLLLASCLVQLANTIVDPPMVEPEELCASASRDGDRREGPITFFFGQSKTTFDKAENIPTPKGLFECQTCKKVFNSHQALGGHRASHKKVKGCYAAKQDQHDDKSISHIDDVITHEQFLQSKSTPPLEFEQGLSMIGTAKRKSKVHECSICHRVFASGQALGGHKRCHWIVSNAQEATPMTKFPFLGDVDNTVHQHVHDGRSNIDKSVGLDLNVPAWAHMSGVRRDPRNPLSFDVSTDSHMDPWTNCETETITNVATRGSNA